MRRMLNKEDFYIKGEGIDLDGKTLNAGTVWSDSIVSTGDIRFTGTLYATQNVWSGSEAIKFERSGTATNFMYFGNTGCIPYIRSGLSSTSEAHAYITTKDNKQYTIVDSNNLNTYIGNAEGLSICGGKITDNTQQWISYKAIQTPKKWPLRATVTVVNGSDIWQGSFVLFPGDETKAKAKTSFIIPYSSTEYAVCQAYLISDSTEGTVGALKINLDNMVLASGFTVSVNYKYIFN